MWWVTPASGHISAAGQPGTQRVLAPPGEIKLPGLDARLSPGVGGPRDPWEGVRRGQKPQLPPALPGAR